MRESGRVLRFDQDRGFGFVVPDEGGPDLFLHVSAFARGTDVRAIQRGIAVAFEREDSARGPKAVRVEVPGVLPAARVSSPEAAAARAGEPEAPTVAAWARLWQEAAQAAMDALMERARANGWVQE